MNHIIEQIQAGSVKASDLADWALAHGVGALTTKEVAHLAGVRKEHVPQRMASLKRRNRIFSPARGLWVPVEPQYREWGAPDPMVYIDDLMAYLGSSYRVGWLSAAALHGASHQAPQVFQVAVKRPIRARNLGRSRLEFYVRENVDSMSLSEKGGHAKVASPGTTMLMLASDENLGGGLNNIATLLVELAEENPNYKDQLLTDACLFPDAALRRVGWLLDEFGEGAPQELARLAATFDSSTSFLSTNSERRGKFDVKWNLILNSEVDPDL